MTQTIRLLGACATVAPSLSAAQAADQPYSFALWGDMPYAKANDAPKLPALISDMNASGIAFSLYDGGNEWTDCHCTNNGGYDNLERLDHVREVMLAKP